MFQDLGAHCVNSCSFKEEEDCSAFYYSLSGIVSPFKTGNMLLYAFHPLLCQKLCWHNQRKPGFHMFICDGDNRATQFLIQKIAIDVQCGNAASVMAMIPSS